MAKWHEDGHTKVADCQLFVREKQPGSYKAEVKPNMIGHNWEEHFQALDLETARVEALQKLKDFASLQMRGMQGKYSTIIFQCRQKLGEI